MQQQMMNIAIPNQPKKLLACAKCYKLHRKCTGESRPCDYCKERKLECVENPDRKKRGRPKGSKNKFKSTAHLMGMEGLERQMPLDNSRKRALYTPSYGEMNEMYPQVYEQHQVEPSPYLDYQKRPKVMNELNTTPYQVRRQPALYAPVEVNDIQPDTSHYHRHTFPTVSYQPRFEPQPSPVPYEYQPQPLLTTNVVPLSPSLPIMPSSLAHIPPSVPLLNQSNFQGSINESQGSSVDLSLSESEYTAPLCPYENQMHTLTETEYNLCQKFPLSEVSRDLVVASQLAKEESNTSIQAPAVNCSNCSTEMLTFKFCPNCGTPREKQEIAQKKQEMPKMSRKKILSLAILEIVNINNSGSSLQESLDSQQTVWFVVKHPSEIESALDYSLQAAALKQVSPNWLSFFGYKNSEIQKSFVSKFVAPQVELSPKALSKWESLSDFSARNSTVSYSCEFVLCHKHGILYGVELQVTSFTKNGRPDTSFVVVKKIWLLMNPFEAVNILNEPKIEVDSGKAISEGLGEEEEEEEGDEFAPNPNFELLRRAVTHKKLELF